MTKFEEFLNGSKKVLLISSQPLDPDCISSGIVMKKYLQHLGLDVTFRFPKELSEEEISRNSYLPFFNEFESGDTRNFLVDDSFDTWVLLDGVNWIQFYDFKNDDLTAPILNKNKKIIQIDHHPGNPEDLTELQIKNESASSTIEILLTEIIPESFLNKEFATLGYFGLMGDTGNFRWKFSATTMELASKLLKNGANPTELIENMFSLKKREYLEMLKYVLDNVEYDEDLKTVFLFLPLEKQENDSLNGDNYKLIRDAFLSEIAINVIGYHRGFIVSEFKTKGRLKISGRGSTLNNNISLQDMFKELGGNGGGHFNASGMEAYCDFEEFKTRLKEVIKSKL